MASMRIKPLRRSPDSPLGRGIAVIIEQGVLAELLEPGLFVRQVQIVES
jgi:hypothetical protein